MPGPNVEALDYTYCTQDDVERLLSANGVLLRLDDDPDDVVSVTEQDAMTNCIVEATETINFYCYTYYSPQALSTSNWVNRRATYFAAYALCIRRGNPAPEALERMIERITEELMLILSGKAQIPGVPLRQAFAPVMDNVRVVLSPYNFKCIRVERRSSSQHNPTSLPVQTDYQEQYSPEVP